MSEALGLLRSRFSSGHQRQLRRLQAVRRAAPAEATVKQRCAPNAPDVHATAAGRTSRKGTDSQTSGRVSRAGPGASQLRLTLAVTSVIASLHTGLRRRQQQTGSKEPARAEETSGVFPDRRERGGAEAQRRNVLALLHHGADGRWRGCSPAAADRAERSRTRNSGPGADPSLAPTASERPSPCHCYNLRSTSWRVLAP